MPQNSQIVSQWVSEVVSIESKFEEDYSVASNIAGPPNDSTTEIQENTSRTSDDDNAHENYLVVKVAEKVFIDEINIHLTKSSYSVPSNAGLFKIEAQEDNEKWFCMWQKKENNLEQRPIKFLKPTVTPTPFKCDTIKLSFKNKIGYILAIEINGSKKILERNVSIDPTFVETYGGLAKSLQKLIGNDLFADVYFEVDGKRVAGHRNILASRSEYFAAMIASGFKESSQENPIYIPDLSYEVFIQIINFLYTGHVDTVKLRPNVAVELIRASDLLNLSKLEEFVYYYLSDTINENNVIEIFREACESLPELPNILELCYEEMSVKFSAIVETEEFIALPQKLMLKILENVVPILPSVEPVANTNDEVRVDEAHFAESDSDDSDD